MKIINIGLICLLASSCGLVNQEQRQIYVADKYVKRIGENYVKIVNQGGKSDHPDYISMSVDDTLVNLEFTSADTYSRLEKDKWCIVSLSGIRIGLLSMFKNIYEVHGCYDEKKDFTNLIPESVNYEYNDKGSMRW